MSSSLTSMARSKWPVYITALKCTVHLGSPEIVKSLIGKIIFFLFSIFFAVAQHMHGCLSGCFRITSDREL
jgi:hypothetical protein